MKRVLLIAALVACFSVTGVGHSFARDQWSGHSFEIGTEISRIKYKEPGLMDTKGTLYGVAGAWTYRENQWMLRVEGKYASGDWDYNGQTWGGLPLAIHDIDVSLLEFRGLLGYDAALSPSAWVTPYVGIGYRYLNDHSQKKYVGGYQRESSYIYSPLGVEMTARVNDAWSWGAVAEYGLFWKGRQVSHMGDVFPGLNDVANTQSKGYGLRGELNVSWRGGMIGVTAGPYIRFWRINDSATSPLFLNGVYLGDLIEPKNRSTETGLKVSLVF